MTNVSEWSVTAGSNNSAPPDGAPENMLPGKVNDVIRENMAACARWYKDSSSLQTTAGTSNAYTLTTNSVYTALSDIPLLTFKTDRANTGAATLNVDGLGAKPWRKDFNLGDFGSGEVVSGQTVVVAYNSGTDDFETIGPAPASAWFPTGTVMVFAQTAAPTGWTKGATHNNKALRLTTGTASSGGTVAFTSLFTTQTISQANLPSYNLAHTLTLPNHIHGHTLTLPNHVHGSDLIHSTTIVSNMTQAGGTIDGVPRTSTSSSSGNPTTNPAIDGAISNPTSNPAISGTVPSGGSGTPIDFSVQYVDVILATKS